jgi:hypothetical protein
MSNRIAEYANARPESNGWYIDKGYLFDYATGRLQRKHGIIYVCGTSLILNANALYNITGIDSRLSECMSQDELLESVLPEYVYLVYGDHLCVVRLFADHGRPLKPLPFRGAAWVVRTGEQMSYYQSIAGGVPPTNAIRRELGCPSKYQDGRASITETISELTISLLSMGKSVMKRTRGFPSMVNHQFYNTAVAKMTECVRTQ